VQYRTTVHTISCLSAANRFRPEGVQWRIDRWGRPGRLLGAGSGRGGVRESVDALFVANIDGQDLNEIWKSHGLLYSSSSTFGAPWINLRAVSGLYFLQCFGAVGWAAGRASGLYKTEWWGAGVVICLEQGCRLAYGPADATVTHCLLLQ